MRKPPDRAAFPVAGKNTGKMDYGKTNDIFDNQNLLKKVKALIQKQISAIPLDALVNKNWTRGNEELERKNEKLD